MPFHHEGSALWPNLRAPLDHRDDVVQLDFADTSALSDVDAFERGRQNDKNGTKLSKKDRARECEEVEHSWGVCGDVTANVVNVGSPHAALGGHHWQYLPVGWGLSLPRSRASSKSTNTPAPVKAPESSTRGGQAMAAGAPNDKVAMPVPNTTHTNGGAAVTKSAGSAVIVEAVHSQSNNFASASLHAKDRNKFVRELLSYIRMR